MAAKYDADNDAEHDKGETPMEELHEQLLKDFKLSHDAFERQAARENAALRFQDPKLQWTAEALSARKGDGATPGRPTLSISLLDQPTNLVINQMRQADLGINVHPVSKEANTETAEMIQGLCMDIQRRGDADIAREWAYARAALAGRGAYEIATEYDPESDDPSDQRIVYRRILHQDGVYFDPAATKADYSDGRFVFLVTWMTPEQFKIAYPGVPIPKEQGSTMFEQFRAKAPLWVKEEDIQVAAYWYKQEKAAKGGGRTKTEVYRCISCGWKILEKPVLWIGRDIPVVPVIGRELQLFDEERRYMGLIEPAMDGQRWYNFAASNAAESMAAEPKVPFIGATGQFEGHEDKWNQINTRNFAYIEYNPVVEQTTQTVLPPPGRVQVDSSKMQLSMMAMQEGKDMVQTATAVFDASLGRLPQKERSGKAIMALQQQADAGTSGYLQNFVKISLPYDGRILMDLIPKVYDRPERIVRIVRGDDKKTDAAMIGVPYTVDPKTKRPTPLPPGAAPNMPGVKEFDLTKGVYSVSVSVGKSFQTRLDQGQEFMREILSSNPQLMPIIGDIFFRYEDRPGSQEIAERLAKMRPPGLGDEDEGQADPNQLKAQIQQMGQQMQAMGQQMQGAMMELKTKQAEQQTKVEIARMDYEARAREDETKMRIAAAENQTKLTLANMEQKFATILELLNLEHEQKKLEQIQRHDASKMIAGHVAAEQQRQSGQAHEVAMNELQRPGPEEPEHMEAE